MRQKAQTRVVVAVVFILAALGAGGCTSQGRVAPVVPKPAVATSPLAVGPILGFELPTHISSVVATLGEPSSVKLPSKDDPSPWGQWFRWKRPDSSATFSALADDYSSHKARRKTVVRFIELRVNGSQVTSSTLLDFALNRTTRAEVAERLGAKARSSSLATRTELSAGKLYHDALKYAQGEFFTYFLFDSNERLVGVAQATFDVDDAD